MRVHELAKELGLENKALLDLCVQLGIEGKKSHSNTLSDDEADKVRRFVIRRAVTDKTGLVREVTKEGSVLTERRVGGVIRRRKKSDEEQAAEQEAEANAISLDEPMHARKELPSLAPDLDAERKQRNEALRQADALFTPKVAVSVDKAVDADELGDIEALPENLEASKTEVDAAVNIESDSETEAVSEEALGLASKVESSEDTAAGEYIAELRKRHDVRTPKVLGKIDLPVKVEPTRRGVDEASTTVESGETAGNRSKGKKKKTVAFESEEDAIERKKPKKKQVLSRGELLDYEGDRDVWKNKKDKKGKRGKDDGSGEGLDGASQAVTKKIVKIQGVISVGEVAKQMSLKASEVIPKLMSLGVMAGINHMLDYDTATILCEEFGFQTTNIEENIEDIVKTITEEEDASKLVIRPPVITVMGHVDHGKTSLLDVIRKTSVAASEQGGITQHIGAYNIKLPSGGSVTFLDTPGHEAFTAMRGRGAKVTDIIVLVVAADDGVMPQTIEAINHAKAANVPIIVAINKMDKPGAQPDKVISQLSEHGLVPEEWGGQTIIAKVSAHTKDGIDSLLENLYLQAEILELKANPERRAVGTIIESRLDKFRGPVITVLVQNGTLKKGELFVAGTAFGRVRALVSDDGTVVDEAGPSIPVEILGASHPGAAGDDFLVLETEAQARRISEDREMRKRNKELAQAGGGPALGGALTLEKFSELVTTNQGTVELPLVIKADVQGSVEAVAQALLQLSNEEVRVRVLHKAVGAISENDVQLASASGALLIAFNVRPDQRAAQMLENSGARIVYSRIIYELVDAVKDAVKGKASPKFQEKHLGRVQVRQTFKVPKIGVVAGSYVLEGTVPRGGLVRLLRDGTVVYEGKMASLRRFKEDIREVQAGYECGIGLEGFGDVKEGDIIEVYKVEQIEV